MFRVFTIVFVHRSLTQNPDEVYHDLYSSSSLDLTEEELEFHKSRFRQKLRVTEYDQEVISNDSTDSSIVLRFEDVRTFFRESRPAVTHQLLSNLRSMSIHWTIDDYHLRFKGITFGESRVFLGSLDDENHDDMEEVGRLNFSGRVLAGGFPDFFDARDFFQSCSDLISHVRDQSNCGSCWSFASTSALSDRFCISSGGRVRVLLSAAHVISCCTPWKTYMSFGCRGGHPSSAWRFFKSHGVVSGSDFDERFSGASCWPYPFDKCFHEVSHVSPHSCLASNPQVEESCLRKCSDKQFSKSLRQDIYRISKYYRLVGVSAIKEEIMTNGPVSASFEVYNDFYTYREGVYIPWDSPLNELVGWHAVKLIGWGIDEDTGNEYWVAVNSWNEFWGEHGIFRIKMNECNIESRVYGGTPIISN